MIKNIKLHGYQRFFLNNIETLDYTPKQKLQIILGSNGSGKSSLLSELNPLPISKNDFREDGYKEITIEYNNNIFKIKNTNSKNSFIVNDNEMNHGGTKKVQLNLIKEYFNLTPRYNNIVLGLEKLTTMSTNDRKEILREMSTVDYSYGIYMYNTLKQQLRDVTGYLKILQVELNQDVTSLPTEEERTLIKIEIDSIKSLIEELTKLYKQQEETKELKHIDFNIDLSKDIDINKLQYEIESKNNLLKEIENEIQVINKEIEELNTYNKTTTETDILKSKIKELEEYFNNLNKLYLDSNFLDKINIKSKLSKVEFYTTKLQGMLDTIRDNDIKFTIEEHKNLKTIIEQQTHLLKSYSYKIETNKEEIKSLEEEMKKHLTITCDNCKHIIHYRPNQDRYNKLYEDIEVYLTKYNKIQEELLELNEKLHKQTSKIQTLKDIRDTYIEADIVNLYNYLVNKEIDNILNISYFQLQNITNQLYKILLDHKDYEEYTRRLKDLSYKLELDNEILRVYKEKHKEDVNKLNNRLKLLFDKKDVIRNEISILYKDIELGKRINRAKEELESNKKNYIHNNKQNIIKNRNRLISKYVNELKSLLITLEDKYFNIEKIKNKIENNEKLISKYEDEKIALTYVVNALSPTEGLIAKSINSFINVFLNEMNTIINSVWSYDITLLPCQVNEQNDLDYLFSVKVDNKKTIDDVKYLSTSMKDIVDLSFKIVFMKYMHLTHIPLMLDEFGVFMDDIHRNKVYNVIENILSNNFTQIFFTANFKSIYGRFVDSNIIILDDKNVELDNLTYNEVIKMKHK